MRGLKVTICVFPCYLQFTSILPMTSVSIIEASKLAKVSRKTLYQHIKDGTLSSSKNRKGHTEIEVSELIRVFGEVTLGDSAKVTVGDSGGREVTQSDTVEKADLPLETLIENAKLKAENAQLRERLDEAREDKERLFAQLAEAQATVKLITYNSDNSAEKKGFFARLFGSK
jgi:hypothetical protein